jgi:hypothetical protein
MYGELVMYHILIVPACMLVIGVLLSFYGSRLVPLALVICALFLGFLYGGSLLASFSSNSLLLRVGPVALAILFSVLVLLLYKASFFAGAVLIGFLAAQVLLPNISLLFAAGIGAIAGALVYLRRNFVFSVLTSLMGASLAAAGIVNLLAWFKVTTGVTHYWLIFAIVATAGFLFQLRKAKGRN